mmetsp:Transcript_132986/g.413489  ORF Transcript_132986/g.413489 Transcript_132986/m.413489 type:complete len:161 (+) Transcript_132986:136-618(+)
MLQPLSNASGSNASAAHNSTAHNSTAAADPFAASGAGGAPLSPAIPRSPRSSGPIWVPLLAAVFVAALLACLARALHRRGWRLLRLGRQPAFRAEDVQLTDLGDWMAANDADDVVVGGPLARPHARTPKAERSGARLPSAVFTTPEKDSSAEYFDLATPR